MTKVKKVKKKQSATYGRFSHDGSEYVIERPDTPEPWINYLFNEKYAALISQTAGGYSFYITPKDSRITRLRYNNMPVDRPGRYLYFRDRETGEYWSPTWQPTMAKLSGYKCRHGVGYTIISSSYRSIKTEITYFVPPQDALEIWSVKIENSGHKSITLDIFPYVELCLGHALVDLINQPNDKHFNDVWFDENMHTLFASKRYWVRLQGATVKQPNEAWDRVVFFTSSLPAKGFDGMKREFIGSNRSEENPLAVENGKCFNTETDFGDACAALQNRLTIKANEKKEFVILLGTVSKEHYKKETENILERYRSTKLAREAFARTAVYWKSYMNKLVIATPDKEMNTMINVWNKFQNRVTFQMGRNAGYYHGGLLFGQGVRDACQDLFGPLVSEPQLARDRIIEVYRHQFSDGSTLHNYFRLSPGAGERTDHSDTPLWLPIALVHYLKETGEMDFVNTKVPFFDGGSATILEHAIRSVNYPMSNLSKRGLVKFGPGDWNDTLDYMGREGKGESVWNSMCLCYGLRELAALCEQFGKKEQAQSFRNDYKKLAHAINKYCWDGDWYICGTNDRGYVLGTKSDKECRLYLNTQTWSVISGVAPNDRAKKAMDAVYNYLMTPYGPQILKPAFRTVNPSIGLATRCVPGKKENGAVFNHPVSWAVLAECLLRRPNRAYIYYRSSLPVCVSENQDNYRCEPYVYAEYVTSPEHPTAGEASHSWLTGTAAWMQKAITEYLLGVRPEYDGLHIEPLFPPKWMSFEITRYYRGSRLKIKIRQSNISYAAIDGKTLSNWNGILPKLSPGEYAVEVGVKNHF